MRGQGTQREFENTEQYAQWWADEHKGGDWRTLDAWITPGGQDIFALETAGGGRVTHVKVTVRGGVCHAEELDVWDANAQRRVG